MNFFNIFDLIDYFIDYPELYPTNTFKPIDIDITLSSRPTTDKKKETKKPVDSFETKQSTNRRVKIKDVIFSDPATVVFWNDNTKTVVKTRGGEKYDKEKGLAMAIIKKITGNTRDYYEIFKEWCGDGNEE